MKTIFVIAMLITSLSALNACNTVEGFGQDLQQAGRAINDAAD